MRLAFIDIVYGYDAARPEMEAPLGGTTSAVCFLAREMVKAGIACSFFNLLDTPAEKHGIPCHPLSALGTEIRRESFDAYIFCGRWTEELVHLVRAHTKKPLIAWMHESSFETSLTMALDAFDAVVFVSEWQKRINQVFIKSHWCQAVLRNAMNPVVADSFPAGTPILNAKTAPPTLLYAGAFARGAFHIPPLLEKIRAVHTDFKVEIYCNLDPSRHPESDAAYIGWMRNLPNITHMGMVGQTELAKKMRQASVFLAPNPWPETSCIAMMEALASGLKVVTTNRAALPETASGYAKHVPISTHDDPMRFDMTLDYDAFADAVLKALSSADESSLRRQVDFFHGHYQWFQRVAPWESFVKSLG